MIASYQHARFMIGVSSGSGIIPRSICRMEAIRPERLLQPTLSGGPPATSCAFFGLFYFTVVSFLAILSGLNLNYMLHPPPAHDVVIGEWYRFYSIGVVSLLFALSRLLGYCMSWKLLCSQRKKARRSNKVIVVGNTGK
jgi:hypothetical protein